MSTLLVPDTTPGHGSGHLRRSLRLFERLPDATLLIVGDRSHLRELLADVPPERIVEDFDEAEGAWDRVVVDTFRLTADYALRLSRLGPTIAVDPGGRGREYCDYVMDTLPRLDSSPANVSDPAYLELPEPRDDRSRRTGTLVTFGGEDPAGLTEAAARILARSLPGETITVVRPSMRSLGPIAAGVHVLDPLPTLEPLLRTVRAVVTSFGLTAYEASAAGARVVTVAPTRYHDRLARKAGFERAGIGRPDRRRLIRAIEPTEAIGPEGKPEVGAPLVDSATGPPRDLTRRIRDLPLPTVRGCPAHPGTHGPAIWRDEEKSYFVCPVCGLRYLERFAVDEEAYDEAYFMQEYERQYGKTYLDDFEHIYGLGRERLVRARSVARRPLRTVLDVGCAYGPFLAAARDSGLEPYGVDVAGAAIDHVVERLGIRAARGDILTLDPERALGRRVFDLVTLWYVVEHFAHLDLLLARLSSFVEPGGVLALGTPHGAGVSAKRATDSFYRVSPRDHFTVWDRASARRVLGEYGFSVRAFRVTGHHPERYPGVGAGWMPGALAGLHSRVFAGGDTFESYAVKEKR
jgi:SAM-dependent methyltransferase/spore coat polysaccharide biosynthesis predicted glycosyltransferase SpsG